MFNGFSFSLQDEKNPRELMYNAVHVQPWESILNISKLYT